MERIIREGLAKGDISEIGESSIPKVVPPNKETFHWEEDGIKKADVSWVRDINGKEEI